MAAKGNERIKREQALQRRLVKLWERGQSPYCQVRESAIHGRGVYATSFIPKDQKIIEYLGELISKKESEKRAERQQEKSRRTGDAAVYIFTINKNYDLDGNVPWNIARLINHSCDPNCEAQIEGERIFIHALRDIHPGEELCYDYGFDVDCFEEHPCRCGRPQCIGYIVGRDHWPELKLRLGEPRGKRAVRDSA